MGNVTEYPSGVFCWIDLATADVASAKEFYGRLFGWSFEEGAEGNNGNELIARLDGQDIAAVVAGAGGQAVWRSWISAPDLKETIEQARLLGAEQLDQPEDDPHRAAQLRDPTGAVFGLWRPDGRIGATVVNEVGSWSWNELTSTGPQDAAKFYAALFGWQAEMMPSPIPRQTLTKGHLLVGGIHAPNPGEGDDSRWGVAFRVADVDGSLAETERLGGRTLLPAMDIPIGRFAIVADPQGAAFTLSSFAGSFRGVDGS